MAILKDFDEILDKNLFDEINKNPNCRYMSWEHCYAFFYLNREKILQDNKMLDLAALHLGFYLGNWGMFRKSFLMDNDYKIHIPVIKNLLTECNELWQTYDKITWDNFKKANKIIKDGYSQYYVNKNFSTILISKILLGIFGCIPAYDKYFKNGAKNKKLIWHNYTNKSYDDIKNLLQKLNFKKRSLKFNTQISYPSMRLIDAYFWFKGKEIKNSTLNNEIAID